MVHDQVEYDMTEFESTMFKHGTPQGIAFYHWNGKIPACRKCLLWLDREVKKATGFRWPDAIQGDAEIRERRIKYHEEYNPNRPEAKERRKLREVRQQAEKSGAIAISSNDLNKAVSKLSRGFMAVRYEIGTEALRMCGLEAARMIDCKYIAATLDFHNRFEPIVPDDFLDKHYNGRYGAYLLAAADALEIHDPILSPISFFMYCGEHFHQVEMIHGAPIGWKDMHEDLQGRFEPAVYWQ